MYEREREFIVFAEIVRHHIANYTIPQYGDRPDDQVEDWTASQCVECIKRYTNRFESNRRGRLETLRDLAKIAHYAGLAFFKLQPTKEEMMQIKEGSN